MKLHNKKATFLTFDIFDSLPFIRHCFSTRVGGVSSGVFSSLNLGVKKGDTDENVLENYKILSGAVGFDHENIVFSNQVHDTKIKYVTEKDRGKGLIYPNDIKDIDGLITDRPNIVLTTFYADCVPLFFVEPKKKVIALSHSGWKGTVNKIALKTIDILVNDFNSNKNDILVGVGPSICKNCFEVDEPVYNEFANSFPYISDYVSIVPKGEINKYHIDMWNINKKMMVDAGIPESNIEITDYCTKCKGDLFYSHRNMGNERGSLAAFMELVES